MINKQTINRLNDAASYSKLAVTKYKELWETLSKASKKRLLKAGIPKSTEEYIEGLRKGSMNIIEKKYDHTLHETGMLPLKFYIKSWKSMAGKNKPSAIIHGIRTAFKENVPASGDYLHNNSYKIVIIPRTHRSIYRLINNKDIQGFLSDSKARLSHEMSLRHEAYETAESELKNKLHAPGKLYVARKGRVVQTATHNNFNVIGREAETIRQLPLKSNYLRNYFKKMRAETGETKAIKKLTGIDIWKDKITPEVHKKLRRLGPIYVDPHGNIADIGPDFKPVDWDGSPLEIIGNK